MAQRGLDKQSLTGIFLLCLCTFGYEPVTSQFYYGSGWPFVPILFVIIYISGVRYVRKGQLRVWVKWLICLAPFAYAFVRSNVDFE